MRDCVVWDGGLVGGLLEREKRTAQGIGFSLLSPHLTLNTELGDSVVITYVGDGRSNVARNISEARAEICEFGELGASYVKRSE